MPSHQYDKSFFWFRRDLRDYDNTGLAAALGDSREVFCVFLFDREILDTLPRKFDRRVDFIHRSVID
jgi:deoxyribodipyrimidine photo-lyase